MSAVESITVGRFTLEADDTLSGPADYMREQGNAKVDAMLSGTDAAFNVSIQFQPDLRTLLLVMLQTDYAGWRGQKQMEQLLSH